MNEVASLAIWVLSAAGSVELVGELMIWAKTASTLAWCDAVVVSVWFAAEIWLVAIAGRTPSSSTSRTTRATAPATICRW